MPEIPLIKDLLASVEKLESKNWGEQIR